MIERLPRRAKVALLAALWTVTASVALSPLWAPALDTAAGTGADRTPPPAPEPPPPRTGLLPDVTHAPDLPEDVRTPDADVAGEEVHVDPEAAEPEGTDLPTPDLPGLRVPLS